MPDSRTTLVLGGGLSGLAAARALGARGGDCIVLERCPTPGGLTRTVEVGDFCFDYTGHFLHLAHYATPADVPHAGLDDGDWVSIERRAACYVDGHLVPAPIQYHLGDLPPGERARCLAAYEDRPQATGADSFRDFIVSGFGQRLADLFLIPQNEKTMAIALEGLSRNAVRRFFPPPDDALIRRGLVPGSPGPPGYNSRFWYPARGGIGRLVHGLAAGVERIIPNEEAVALELATRSLLTRSGRRYRWDAMLSSVPLKQLCAISGDRELQEAGRGLSHSATISFNIGLRGALPACFRGLHWIYVPERALPFYRVGFYSEISPGTVAAGCSSMYVEVGVPGERLADMDIAGELQPRVIDALVGLGWLERRRIAALAVHAIECAYVHHTPDRDERVDGIRQRLAAHGIVTIGRYGSWDYTSMEDSIRSALAAADALAI